MKAFFLLSAFCFLLFLLGCGSSGTGNPSAPHTGPEVFSISYCRVVQVVDEPHLQWSANIPARGEFRYGGSSLSHLVLDSTFADSHDVALHGLLPTTQYIFQLIAIDTAGDTALYTGDFTTGTHTAHAPVISSLQISEITESSARIRWSTDVAASTILYFGQISLTDSLTDDSLSRVHDVTLSNLAPSSAYVFRVEAEDSLQTRSIGPDSSFTTQVRMILSFPDATVALGDTVRLPLFVENVEDLAALHIGLSFVPGSVELIDIEPGAFYSQHQGFMFFRTLHNSSGQGFADMTWNILYQSGEISGTDADGSGIVAYAKLRGLSAGDAHFAFLSDSSFALDAFAAERHCAFVAGTVRVTP